MPAALKITLTTEENQTLQELEVGTNSTQTNKTESNGTAPKCKGMENQSDRRLSRMGRIDSEKNDSSLE